MEISAIIIYILLTGLVLAMGVWLYSKFADRLERRLRPAAAAGGAAPQMIEVALGASRQSVWNWDRARGQFFISPLMEVMLGFEPQALCGAEEKWIALLHPNDHDACLARFDNYAKYKNINFQMEFRLRHADGHYIWIGLRAGMVGARCVGLAGEISERKRMEERLLRGAVYDQLTNLPNRALLLDRLERMIRNAEEGSGPCLVLINLSRFRKINEAWGHLAGDHLLFRIAQRLTQKIPAGGSIARVGADEFAVLVPPHFSDQMPVFVKNLAAKLHAPLQIFGQEIIPSCALGWAMWQQGSAHDLMAAASLAMHQARQMDHGEEAIMQFSSKMRRSDSRHMILSSDLSHALSRGEIEMHYQPIIRLADTKAAGFEALMRWRHPKFGWVAPAEFIPLAEENGAIDELSRFAISSATKELSRWQLTYRHSPPLFVSVNISRCELFRESLVKDVKDSIAQAFLTPNALKLEVTEGLIMRHPDRAAQSLAQLRAAGAHIAIDDFGAGYSSLGWLQHLPFDVIKIDRALIGEGLARAHPYGAEPAAIIRAVVSMAHDMAVEVVAEGTDTSQKAASLCKTGCDYAQGFYYAYPMDKDKVRAFLPRNRPR